jgi:hypothetical protein
MGHPAAWVVSYEIALGKVVNGRERKPTLLAVVESHPGASNAQGWGTGIFHELVSNHSWWQ